MSETPSVPTDIEEYRAFVEKGGLKTATDEGRKETSAAGESQAENESESETDKGTQKEPHQKKSGFQRRVDKLNQKLGAKDAEIAELRRQIEARQSGAAKPANDEKKPAPKPEGEKQQQVEAKPKPQQKDFESYDEYVEALTDWKTDQALNSREQKQRENADKQSAEDATKAVIAAHAARVDEAKTRLDDWDGAFKGLNDQSFTEPMMIAIFESEAGADIAYHLAKHRDELERISKLPMTRQVAEIGKLETRFAKSEDDEAEPATRQSEAKAAKPRVSQAPAPVRPLKGKSTGDDPMPDPADFTAYEAWSKRQAAAGRKR